VLTLREPVLSSHSARRGLAGNVSDFAISAVTEYLGMWL
jgi:hypothetical protein